MKGYSKHPQNSRIGASLPDQFNVILRILFLGWILLFLGWILLFLGWILLFCRGFSWHILCLVERTKWWLENINLSMKFSNSSHVGKWDNGKIFATNSHVKQKKTYIKMCFFSRSPLSNMRFQRISQNISNAQNLRFPCFKQKIQQKI